MPWLYLSAYFEKHKDEYIESLFRVSTHGDWSRWIEFCLYGTIVQANDAIRRCDRFQALRSELHERLANPTRRSHKIVESLFEIPIVNIPALSKRFRVSYKTAQRELEKLVAAGVLCEIKGVHPRRFYAEEVIEIAYGEMEYLNVHAETRRGPTQAQ
jgi:Fic family protein